MTVKVAVYKIYRPSLFNTLFSGKGIFLLLKVSIISLTRTIINKIIRIFNIIITYFDYIIKGAI